MFVFFSGRECKGDEVTEVLGWADISACRNEQPWSTKTRCDSYQREMQAICVEAAFFFLSAPFARFPYPPPLLCPQPPFSHRPAGNGHSMLSRWLPEKKWISLGKWEQWIMKRWMGCAWPMLFIQPGLSQRAMYEIEGSDHRAGKSHG